MLQAIHEKAQGWFAWTIVILLVIPFALWGIQEYIGGGSDPVAASVDGFKIKERDLDNRFQEFKSQLRERLGKAYRPEMFDDTKLRTEVLEDMIRGNLVLQATLDMGLRAGDEQVQATILGIPAFQKDGRFDSAAYERSLRHQGMTSVQFEERTRYSLMSFQLSQVLNSSELVTDQELLESVKLRRQKRDVSYFVVPRERFLPTEPPSDQAIEDYYQSREAEFKTPEQVKLDYLILDRSQLGADQGVDEEGLARLYEEKKAEFKVAEQRQARHILIPVATDADQAEQDKARAEIEALRNRILGGEDFAALAKQYSKDPGSATAGGDLGAFERGVMDPAFDNAVFSQNQGQLSMPVRSRFGYHLIEVTQIQPERVKSLEEVRPQLVKLQQSGGAERKYYELTERLGSLSYEHPDSLIPAAETLGLKVLTSDWIGRQGGADLLANPKVVAAAFSDDVLRQGNNSDLIELDSKGNAVTLVLRVAEHREAAQKPLAEVRDQIVQAIRADQALKAAQQAADQLVTRLRAGATLDQVAAGYELKKAGWIDRDNREVPVAVVQSAFTLAHPGAGAMSFAATQVAEGQAVVALAGVQEGALAGVDEAQQKADRQTLAQAQARTYHDRFVDDLRQRAKVSINLKQRASVE